MAKNPHKQKVYLCSNEEEFKELEEEYGVAARWMIPPSKMKAPHYVNAWKWDGKNPAWPVHGTDVY